MSDNFIKVFDHGTGKIDLTGRGIVVQMRPIELHYKQDGTLDNKPSFAVVMEGSDQEPLVVGQFSLATLQEALAELGYTLHQP